MNYNKFKVGDKVKIIKGRENWTKAMDEHIGKVFTINRIEENGLHTIVKFDINDREVNHWTWQPYRGHCELYIEEQVAQILDNQTVINSKGEILQIGDNVQYSKRFDLKPYIIQNFEQYQNGQIRAIARINNKIRNCNIEDLELVIEPKKPETLIEKALRLYPIGTKVKCLQGWTNINGETGIIKDNKFRDYTRNSNTIWVNGSRLGLCIYKNGQWAEIINYD